MCGWKWKRVCVFVCIYELSAKKKEWKGFKNLARKKKGKLWIYRKTLDYGKDPPYIQYCKCARAYFSRGTLRKVKWNKNENGEEWSMHVDRPWVFYPHHHHSPSHHITRIFFRARKVKERKCNAHKIHKNIYFESKQNHCSYLCSRYFSCLHLSFFPRNPFYFQVLCICQHVIHIITELKR